MSLIEGNYQQKIMRRALILGLLLTGIILLVFSNPKQYVYGLIFGTTINVLNFRLMGITFEKAVEKPPNKIMVYITVNYLIRYTIYGIVLIISSVADYISLYTVIFGLFMIKIVILSGTIYDIILSKLKKV